MATSTTNLGLTKPAGTDKIRIAQINGNMDILDEKIGAVGNTSLQAQVTSQNQAITNLNNRFTKLVSPDLNNVRTSGLYYVQGATHSPGGSSNWWGFVTVISNSEQSEIKQVFYVNSSDATYTRYLRNSAWSDWQEFALNSDTLSISTGNVTAIASGANFNNYTTPGTYSVANYSTATGITNMPVVQAGRLIVAYGAGGTDYIRQIYIPYGSNDIYTRYNTGSWSDWSQLAVTPGYVEISSQLTPTNVTISIALKQEIGRLVFVYLYLNTTSAITALSDIISGLPTPISTHNYVCTFLAHSASGDTNTYRMCVMDGGKIRTLDNIPTGTVIRATFQYFKAV